MSRLANEISNDILEDLNNVDLATDVGRKIAEARDFTRIYHDKFSRGTVGSLLSKKAITLCLFVASRSIPLYASLFQWPVRYKVSSCVRGIKTY